MSIFVRKMEFEFEEDSNDGDSTPTIGFEESCALEELSMLSDDCEEDEYSAECASDTELVTGEVEEEIEEMCNYGGNATPVDIPLNNYLEDDQSGSFISSVTPGSVSLSLASRTEFIIPEDSIEPRKSSRAKVSRRVQRRRSYEKVDARNQRTKKRRQHDQHVRVENRAKLFGQTDNEHQQDTAESGTLVLSSDVVQIPRKSDPLNAFLNPASRPEIDPATRLSRCSFTTRREGHSVFFCCCYCLDMKRGSELFVLTNCQHQVCRKCLNKWTTKAFREGGLYNLLCPDCKKHIHYKDLPHIFQGDVFHWYNERLVDRLLHRVIHNPSECPNCNCSFEDTSSFDIPERIPTECLPRNAAILSSRSSLPFGLIIHCEECGVHICSICLRELEEHWADVDGCCSRDPGFTIITSCLCQLAPDLSTRVLLQREARSYIARFADGDRDYEETVDEIPKVLSNEELVACPYCHILTEKVEETCRGVLCSYCSYQYHFGDDPG